MSELASMPTPPRRTLVRLVVLPVVGVLLAALAPAAAAQPTVPARLPGTADVVADCDSQVSNGDGTTTYGDVTPPDAVLATWAPAHLVVGPKTPATRVVVRFFESCSGVKQATAVLRNATSRREATVRLTLVSYNVIDRTEDWVVVLTSTPADAGNWSVRSVSASDISRRFTVNDATGVIVGVSAPGNSVVDTTIAGTPQTVRRASALSLKVAPATVRRGHSTKISGTLGYYAGTRWPAVSRGVVVLRYRLATSTTWRPLRTLTTDTRGRYTWRWAPASSVVIRATYAGSALNAPVSSKDARVTVR